MQLLYGHDSAITRWAAQRIDGLSMPTHVVGLIDGDGVLRGCFLLNEITRNTAEFIILCQGRLGVEVVRPIFRYAFHHYGRLQATVQRSNAVCRKQTPRWGFKYDGTAHDFFAPGEDAIRFVMRRDDCKWIKPHGHVLQAESARAA